MNNRPNTISRTYKGIQAHAKPGKDMDSEHYITFRYALCAYGFLVGLNESITLEDWKARILKTYSRSERINRTIEAIDAATV
jgi:hypothetical protein